MPVLSPSTVISCSEYTEHYREFRNSQFGNSEARARDAALIHYRKMIAWEDTGLLEFDRPQRERWGYIVAGYPTDQYEEALRHANLGLYWDSERRKPVLEPSINNMLGFSINDIGHRSMHIIKATAWKDIIDDPRIDDLIATLGMASHMSSLDIRWDTENNRPDVDAAVRLYRTYFFRSTISGLMMENLVKNTRQWVEHFPDREDVRELHDDFVLEMLSRDLVGENYRRPDYALG